MRALLTSGLLSGIALAAFTAASAGQLSHSFTSSKLLIDSVLGDVTVNVVPGATGITVSATGDDKFTSLVTFQQNGDRAEIVMGDLSYSSSENLQTLQVTVTVPPGTDLAVEDHIGNLAIGDTRAPVAIEAVAGSITVGSATSVALETAGSADISVTEATAALSIDTSGSGTVKVGRAGPTSISISGSGDAEIGPVSGSLGIDLSGSANVTVASVNGAVAISTSGSSDVYITAGHASPFAADTSGSGSIYFAGTAVNPQISTSGSGEICLGAAEGTIQSEGSITISPTACKRG